MNKIIRLKSDDEFDSLALTIEFNPTTKSNEPMIVVNGGRSSIGPQIFLSDYEARLLSEQLLRAVRISEKRNGALPVEVLREAYEDFSELERELESNDM